MFKQSNRRHLPNWRLTERDLAIVGEVLRWQQLTTSQIARWFFASPRTASNRIAVLQQLGYLKTIEIPWRASALVTATAKGARARADLQLRTRASEPGRLLHDLTVVQVAASMLDQDPQAAWITERELLRDELTAARDLDGRLRRGPGRRPDGVLVRANHRQEAVEVELTPKRDRTEYDRKLSWYLGQTHYQRVHWFAPSFSLRDRLRRVAREIHMDDFVKVAPLPPGLDYPPGVKANREPSRLDVAADVDAAARIYRCRAAGFTPRGMVDCMIAAVAWRHRASLLAQDVDLQRNAGQHVHSANTRRVFVVFEELCDIWDDIHGLGYGLVTREFLDFHETVLRKLLNAIVEWASALNDKELHSAAVAAEEAYTNAVDDFVARLNDE